MLTPIRSYSYLLIRHIFTGEEHRNVLSVKKSQEKGTKPPVWRRCTVAADVHFANMAAMLEKLVQYPAGSLYEIEFFSEKSNRSVRTVTEKRRIISHY